MGFKLSFGKDKEEKVLKIIKIPIKKKKKQVDDSSGFILRWEKQLGYSGDPFKPGIIEPVSDTIVGLDKEREMLNMFIVEKGKFANIAGKRFTGKTILLKWLEEKLERYRGEVIVNSIEGSELKEDKLPDILLKPFGDKFSKDEPIDKLLKQKLSDRKYVLLVDNLDKLTKEMTSFFNKLFVYHDLQIIATSNGVLEIPKPGEEEINCFSDALKINLKGMSFDSAKEMVKKRMMKYGAKRFYPFDKELFEKVWDDSGKNPVKFLEACRKKAISFAIKKSKGMNLEDVRSYEKDGIDVSEIKFEEKKSEEKKDNAYKIEVINRGTQDIIVDGVDKKHIKVHKK